jgi:HlyD family secretion protein
MNLILISIGQLGGKIKAYIFAHKIISVIALVILLGGGWWTYGVLTSTTGESTYVMGTVGNGTVVASLAESGQLSADQQLNLTSQVSGQVVYVGVKPGQAVKAGTLIAEVDPTTAQQAVTSAQSSLAAAKLALAKLQEPPTQLATTQDQNAVTNAQTSISTTDTNAHNDITSAFLDLPNVVTGLQEAVTGYDFTKSQWNADYYLNSISKYNANTQSFRDDAYNSYISAQTTFNTSLSDYRSADLTDPAKVSKILAEAYSTTQAISDAVKKSTALVQLYEDTLKANGQTPNTVADTQLTTLAGLTSTVNGHLSTLLADQNSLTTDQENITVTQQSLTQLQTGADPLDIQSAQLNVTNAQNSLAAAQGTLAKYYIRAPFDGTVGTVAVNKYDQASGAIATLITNQQYADLSVNEVDAAKINVGDKATLTFSALSNLTLTGTVAEKNPVGTVTQGVVSYDIRIALDAQNSQIDPGMTLTAKIITKTAPNALIVPSSAIKTQGGQSYVLAFNPPVPQSNASTTGNSANASITTSVAPQKIPVTVGINDSVNTQIISGLTLGQQIVVRTTAVGTVAPTAAASATTRTGGGGFGGGGGAGGGTANVLRGL